MGCSGCSTRGNGLPAGCNNNGACGTGGSCAKLHVFDWLANVQPPQGQKPFDLVEIRFKNTRKEYYRNTDGKSYKIGDTVVVEALSGYDVGTVSITGDLVKIQMKKRGLDPHATDYKKILRFATDTDIAKWKEALALEESTMITSRRIANQLKLKMKISDVEYQGDKSKATFFYTAEERVDFRELLKQLIDEFRVKVEMKQIGTRQEAGRLGGLGICGRELCCSTWLTDFRSVTNSAARYQQLSLNPQKLAGQCGKLKCCLNYELDSYADALKDFPDTNTKIETTEGTLYHFKSDIFKRVLVFTQKSENSQEQFVTLNVEQVKEYTALNKKGVKVAGITAAKPEKSAKIEHSFMNAMGEENIDRFDKPRNKKKKNKNKNKGNRPNA